MVYVQPSYHDCSQSSITFPRFSLTARLWMQGRLIDQRIEVF
jgi:hypothetical protein